MGNIISGDKEGDKEGDKNDSVSDTVNQVINYQLINDNIYDRIYEIKSFYYTNRSRELTEKIKFGELYKEESLVKELQEEKISIQKEMAKLVVIKKLKNGAESNEWRR